MSAFARKTALSSFIDFALCSARRAHSAHCTPHTLRPNAGAVVFSNDNIADLYSLATRFSIASLISLCNSYISINVSSLVFTVFTNTQENVAELITTPPLSSGGRRRNSGFAHVITNDFSDDVRERIKDVKQKVEQWSKVDRNRKQGLCALRCMRAQEVTRLQS